MLYQLFGFQFLMAVAVQNTEFGTFWGSTLLHWHEELNAKEAAQEEGT